MSGLKQEHQKEDRMNKITIWDWMLVTHLAECLVKLAKMYPGSSLLIYEGWEWQISYPVQGRRDDH